MEKKTLKGVQTRTQRVTWALMLVVGILFGEMTPNAILAKEKNEEHVVVAYEEREELEMKRPQLTKLPQVETGSLEGNVFFEKAQTDMGEIIDDAPSITKKRAEETKLQEIGVTDFKGTEQVLIQRIEEVKNYGMVTCNRLNFRKGPGVKFGIKKVLTKGNVCEILSRTKSGWYHVKVAGSNGYVSAQYMKEINERAALKEQEKQEEKERAEKARKKAEKKLEEETSRKSFQGVQLQHSKPYKITSNPLNRRMGVKEYKGHKETYYSQKVLSGGGLSIPGRHVASDGTIRDKNGFICVAAHEKFMKYGSKLLTSLGPAKVYDTGCSYRTIDVYVNW